MTDDPTRGNDLDEGDLADDEDDRGRAPRRRPEPRPVGSPGHVCSDRRGARRRGPGRRRDLRLHHALRPGGSLEGSRGRCPAGRRLRDGRAAAVSRHADPAGAGHGRAGRGARHAGRIDPGPHRDEPDPDLRDHRHPGLRRGLRRHRARVDGPDAGADRCAPGRRCDRCLADTPDAGPRTSGGRRCTTSRRGR